MNASKENCRKAYNMLAKIRERFRIGTENAEFNQVEHFIIACSRKLPTEAAYQRDKQRRKVKA